MVAITKNGRSLLIPNGAIKQYKGAGWVLDNQAQPAPSKTMGKPLDVPKKAPESQNTAAGVDGEDLETMSMEELKQYASLLGLNVKKVKSRDGLLRAIKTKEG